MKLFTKKEQKGFTIIEVMIVLAIAGLIIGVVLVAVPQLQRNQRNESRKSILGRMKTELDNYAGNNSGSYPAANTASAALNFGTPATALGFFQRYMGCSTAGGATTCTTNMNDPKTGTPMGITGGGQTMTTSTAADPANPGDLSYRVGFVCSGETTVAATNRSYALQVGLEGGAIYCLDNK